MTFNAQIKKAIWSLNEEQVKTFLYEIAQHNDEVIDYLSVYIKQVDKSSSFEEIIREKLSLACKKHDRENADNDYGYDEWYTFGDELEELGKTILLSSETDTIKVTLFNEMLKELASRDDNSHDGYSHDILEDILSEIEEHDHSHCIKKGIRPILKQISYQRNGNGLINDVANDYWECWASTMEDMKEVEQKLRRIALADDSSYEVKKYCSFLSNNGKEDEIRPFLLDNRKKKSIRKVLIENAIENQEYALAEKTIREVLLDSDYGWYINNALLTLGEKSKNRDLALEAAERIFKENSGFEEYTLLKKWHDKKSWPERSLKIITQIKTGRGYAKPYTLAAIYSEEHMIDELSGILLSDPVDLQLLLKHYKMILNKYQKETVNCFVKGVRKHVTGPADPKRYAYSIMLLKTIQTLPNGREICQKLKSEFMVTCKRRPKFIAMLQNL